MFEESVSSSPTFWSSLTSWFTPTVFFLLLQLVIATIYIISSLSNNNNATHKHNQQHQHEQLDPHESNHFQHQQQPLARSPSLLHRLKSINFYSYPHTSQHPHETQQPQQHHQQHQHEQDPHDTNHFQQQTPLVRSPSLLQRLTSINFYSYYPHTSQHTHETQQQPPQQQQQQQPPQLPRSPSSVLQRLKSINLQTYFPTEPFSSYFTHEKNLEQPQKKTHVREKTPPVEKTQQEVNKEEEQEEQEEYDDDVVGEMFQNNNNLEVQDDDDDEEDSCASMDEIFSKLQQGQDGHFTRTQSDTKPASGEIPVRLPRKMKKSASTKSAFSHFEEGDIVESRRPATARDGAAAAGDDGGDGGVDAKADDFINRFKQQLKLQRLDSIMRYKEMIGRGSGK